MNKKRKKTYDDSDFDDKSENSGEDIDNIKEEHLLDQDWGGMGDDNFLDLSGSIDLQADYLTRNLEDIIEESNDSGGESGYSTPKGVSTCLFICVWFTFG